MVLPMAELGGVRDQGLLSASGRPFLAFSLASGVSLIGTWMQKIGVGWLGWSLTHSAAWVGLLAFCDLFPSVVAAPLAGALADRVNPFHLLRLTQIASALQALALFLLAAADALPIGALISLCVIGGLIDGFNQPVRMGVVSQLVPPALLPRGVALGAVIFHLARCVGPACAGLLLLQGGVAPVFLVNAVATALFVAVLFTLPLPRGMPVVRRPRRELGREIGQGLAYAVHQPTIATLLLLTTVVCLLIRPYVELLPGLTGLLFDGRPETLARLTSANGAGALVGGLVMLALPYDGRRLAWRIFGGIIGLALAVIVFAAGGTLALALPALVVAGFFQVTVMVSNQSLIQLATDPALRGRVLSLYGVLFRGGPGLGALAIGASADLVGLAPALIAGAGAAVLVTLALAWGRPGTVPLASATPGSPLPDLSDPAGEGGLAFDHLVDQPLDRERRQGLP